MRTSLVRTARQRDQDVRSLRPRRMSRPMIQLQRDRTRQLKRRRLTHLLILPEAFVSERIEEVGEERDDRRRLSERARHPAPDPMWLRPKPLGRYGRLPDLGLGAPKAG